VKIVIVAGGTGGHIFPAIALGRELQKRGYQGITFITNENPRAKSLIDDAGFSYEVLDVPKMPYGLSYKWIGFFPKLLLSRFDAEDLITLLSPNIAIGFGAYISGPVISIAKKKGIKTLIHEQNASLGRANKLLLRKADKVCFGFSHKLIKSKQKHILTGNPIRSSLLSGLKGFTKEEASMKLGLSLSKKAVLVLGGSRGASAINSLVTKAIAELDELEKSRIQLFHIAGEEDFESVSREYRLCGIEHVVKGFYEDMHLCYKAADLIICRSGAGTLSEVAIFGIPAILVPYPWAGYHQKKNAEAIAKSGGAIVMEQEKVRPSDLNKEMLDIVDNDKLRHKMASNMRSLAKIDATDRLAEVVEGLLNAQ